MELLRLTPGALDYAAKVHAGQCRKADGAPFTLHPRDVARLLHDAGAPDHLIAAGALHDVLEKTATPPAELRARFGGTVASLVLAVSEDKRIAGYRERKTALREQVAGAGHDALMLFAADKISKARELCMEIRAGHRPHDRGARKRHRRLEHYQACMALLRQRLPDSPLVDQLAAELENLSELILDQRVSVG
jgi:(p)ppGpp synthase/HD superfamily hydrolase